MLRTIAFVLLASACASSDPNADPGTDPGSDPPPTEPDAGSDGGFDAEPPGADAEPDDAAAPLEDAEAPVDAQPTDPNAKSILVYSNNIENMLFDWKDLVHVMARDARIVDVFLVQQITNKKRVDELADFMTKRLGEKYAGIVAQNQPTHQRFAADVVPKPTVTTGVIWRTARFDELGHESWFPWGDKVGGSHTCGSRTNNSGYETIRVRLFDKWAQKKVAVASLRHWTWQDCSEKNMIEMIDGQPSGANAHPPMPDFALQIVGGDFNGKAFDASGDFRCWYRVTVADLGGQACSGHENLGFADALYDQCNGAPKCVDADSGIDFVFGRKQGGKPADTKGFDVISYAAGDAADVAETGSDKLSNHESTHGFKDVTGNYSQHRARRAVFFY